MQTLTRGSFTKPGSSLEFRTGDWRMAHPVYRHREAPCAIACPAGENPQAYIAKAAEGDFHSAWQILVSANPIPATTGRVCHHPCESACNRGLYDEAIAIHSVERFLGDRAIAEGWKYPVLQPPSDAPAIAVIGSGPAGLSAAYHLLSLGYRPTIFEAQPEAGGLLRSALPAYRLPREVLNSELERLLATGIAFEPGKRIGRDLSLDELRADFRAVFIAIGNGRPREWSADGAVPADLRSGIDLLKEWISVGALPSYQRVAIIGGGNTAIDLARVLKFNGSTEVHVITFQALPGAGVDPADAMSATAREIMQAIEEGVTVHPHRGVRRLILRGNSVVGVEMVHMQEMVEGGLRKLVAFEGTEAVLKVDQVIPAVGQLVDPSGFENLLGPSGYFIPDEFGAIRGHRGIFVGGDARGGAGSVTRAVGDGRRAAAAIRSYLSGHIERPPDSVHHPIGISDLNLNYFDHAVRVPSSIVAPEERSVQVEIEGPLSLDGLNNEVQRCFSCGECMSCDNCWTLCPDNSVLKERRSDGEWHYVFDYDHCKGCGICAQECPVGFIGMVDES